MREAISSAAPRLTRELGALAEAWAKPARERLEQGNAPSVPKVFNDPVWENIELRPWEVLLLDTPLLQRLRGVRQLGLAHYVYPGACHDRLQHSLGVLEAAERMLQSLAHHADNRRLFERPDEPVPAPSALDVVSIRLGALLHDIGHGPFSHTTERFIESRYAEEFRALTRLFQERFEGTTRVQASEAIAVLVVLSEPLRRVFEHHGFARQVGVDRAELPFAIAARLLGSRAQLDAGYLSGIVSGPLDADKLDYMARDSLHAGLPLGLDTRRIISKLAVVSIRPEQAPNSELRRRAEAAQDSVLYELGISIRAVAAYDQLIIGRVNLYDRLYYHPKVRCAEAMARQLVRVAEQEQGREYGVTDFFAPVADETMIDLLGGIVQHDTIRGGAERAKALATLIRFRPLYHRAHAFAARFVAGLDGLSESERSDTRAALWIRLLESLDTEEKCAQAAKRIFDLAVSLAEKVPPLRRYGEGLLEEHVLVDLPPNKVATRGGDILTRAAGGRIGTPNAFFNAERWAKAYEQRRQCGFVFSPEAHVPLVALAAKLFLYGAYGLVTNDAAEDTAKTPGLVEDEWLELAAAAGVCSGEAADALRRGRSKFFTFQADDIPVPDSWRDADPDLAERLASELNQALPRGLSAGLFEYTCQALEDLTRFVALSDGEFVNADKPDETKDLQRLMMQHMQSRDREALEGAKFGGGESDVVFPGKIVIENKVRTETDDPLNVGPNYDWQARRYSIPLCTNVAGVVVAYKPKSEAGLLPLQDRIRVESSGPEGEQRAVIRVVVPYGHASPHKAKKPPAGGK